MTTAALLSPSVGLQTPLPPNASESQRTVTSDPGERAPAPVAPLAGEGVSVAPGDALAGGWPACEAFPLPAGKDDAEAHGCRACRASLRASCWQRREVQRSASPAEGERETLLTMPPCIRVRSGVVHVFGTFQG